jgi:nucleoside-diphosphate-sugar epimerase
MRVFLTGATGFIGSAIVKELIGAGHQVTGLARSDAGAKSLEAAGAQVHRGDLEDLEGLRKGAAASEGVIHTGFNHDFSKFKANCEADRRAIGALGSALAGSGRPLVITSGTALVAPGRLSTEDDPPGVSSESVPRVASEEAAAALGKDRIRVSVVRLPPTVHGAGDHAFVPILIATARAKGFSAYVGDGKNRWPAVHRLDAASLFVLALEKAAAGARLHGVDEEGVAMRSIAETIGSGLGVPVRGLTASEAAEHFGWFAHFAAIDNPTSSAITRKSLGWSPKGPSLLKDLRDSGYFK